MTRKKGNKDEFDSVTNINYPEKSDSYGLIDNDKSTKFTSETCLTIVESVPNGIVITDKKGEIVYLNTQCEKMFGYERSQLVGEPVEKLIPEQFRREHVIDRCNYMKFPSTRAMGEGRDLYALRSNGETFPVEIGLNFIDTNDGPMVIGTIIDITERVSAEKLINDKELRLRQIMDNTTDSIIVFDQSGAVESLNRAAVKLLSGDEKNSIKQIWETIAPENMADFSNKLSTVSEGKRITDYETQIIAKHGKKIWASISLVGMHDGNTKYIETIRDISERVALRNKIIELEKAQVIGKMAEGFAHHMSTPLASMLLRVQMLKEDLPKLPECERVEDKLNSIERQILYGQKVIQRLLKFVGRPKNEKTMVSVGNLLEESIDMIKPLMKSRGIIIETEITDNLHILADINLIHLVFSDTIMNAVDAMSDGGVITITAVENEDDNFISVSIKDTGTGISEDVMPKVFEPFFTTKPAGKGTGLGLSVAKRIVQNHGGNIELVSKLGIGTSVLILVPKLKEESIA